MSMFTIKFNGYEYVWNAIKSITIGGVNFEKTTGDLDEPVWQGDVDFNNIIRSISIKFNENYTIVDKGGLYAKKDGSMSGNINISFQVLNGNELYGSPYAEFYQDTFQYMEEKDLGSSACIYFRISQPTPPTVKGLPYVNGYEMDVEKLEDLKKYIYKQEDENIKESLKSNIFSMYKVPFSLETENHSNIVINNYDTLVDANIIEDQLYIKSLGNIKIPDYSFDSSIGHKNIMVNLFVPFFPKIELETYKVLNKNIYLELVLNILGNKATLNVYDFENDSLIDSKQKEINDNIPYIIDNSTKDEFSSVLNNQIKQAYCYIYVQVPRNSKTTETPEPIEIGNGKRLLKVDSPIINTNATSTEQEEIKTLLRNGVII